MNMSDEGVEVLRTEQEMIGLILSVAKTDERIRAVSMEGSRANSAVPKDQYQDYDITYYVTDMSTRISIMTPMR